MFTYLHRCFRPYAIRLHLPHAGYLRSAQSIVKVRMLASRGAHGTLLVLSVMAQIPALNLLLPYGWLAKPRALVNILMRSRKLLTVTYSTSLHHVGDTVGEPTWVSLERYE
jgi:hypothetical protein